ncbi:hypothetical protein BCR44DRAFT_133452, partial [Catenaria anguillulae PL171]
MLPDTDLDDPVFTRVIQSAYPRRIPKWTKSNSTSSLYVMCTPCRSELRDMAELVARGMHDMILDSHRSRSFRTHRLFSEDIFPLTRGQSISHPFKPPTFDMVFTFFFSIVDAAQLGSEICIITLVYLDRMLTNARLDLFSANWPRVILGALLLAAKVWDDQAVWNVDFCTIFPDLKVKETNELEGFFLEAMHFNISVRASLFARYYFSLVDRFGPPVSRPLSVRDAVRLAAYPNTTPRPGTSGASQLPEMRLNPQALPSRPVSPGSEEEPTSMSPDNLAAPAALEGVDPGAPVGVAEVRATGIRRVKSDYQFVDRVPAS